MKNYLEYQHQYLPNFPKLQTNKVFVLLTLMTNMAKADLLTQTSKHKKGFECILLLIQSEYCMS